VRARTLAPLVLVAASDREARTRLKGALNQQRMRTVVADYGAETLTQATSHNPDVIVVDCAPPDVDGIRITTKLREWTGAPIIILSASSDERDQIAALDAGANAFLSKPFETAELLARIRVWLRHTQRAQAGALTSILDVGRLRIDFDKRLAFLDGREVRLTPRQYKLFATMMRNAGRVMTHEQILREVWGPACTRETQYLRVYMGQLRQKFEIDASRPKFFITEPNVGYRLRTE
jgi:two-component system KDP operon response regulator KdpE